MTMSELLPSNRIFKVWEYQVSHGQLLVRSPKAPSSQSSPEQTTNLDLVFTSVAYMALPCLLRGIALVLPTQQEIELMRTIVGHELTSEVVIMILSEGHRFSVVANSLKVSENDWDIFDSPFKFRSQFRGA